MRRVLPLLVTVAVTLAACSDDNSDSVPQLSLVEIESTEAPIDDVCATEPSATSDGGTTAGTDDTTVDDTTAGDTSTAATVVEDTAADDTATAEGAPADSDADTSEPTDSDPADSDPADSDPTDSDPTDSDPTGSDPTDSDPTGSEPTDSAPTSEPVETGPYASAPEVDPVDDEPTELVRTVLDEGEGPEAGVGSVVRVYYSGELTADGQVFDSNYGSGEPFEVVIAGEDEQPSVIAGWNEGLIGARAGDRIQLDIPSDLAYGEQGNTSIPPDADLTFVIDVVDVITPELPEETPTELGRTTIVEGDEDGPVADDGTILYVDYVGVYSDTGEVFDHSYGPTGMPFKVELGPEANGVIEGWNEGLHGVRAGERIQLDIPSDLAYGEEGRDSIPPDTALTFVIEVVDLIPMAYPDTEPDELEKTMIDEGDPEGTAAQRYDTVTFHMVIGVPEWAMEEEPAGSSVPDSAPASTDAADDSEPTDTAATTDAADETEPTDTAATTESDDSGPPSSEGDDEPAAAPGFAVINTYDGQTDPSTGQQTPAQPVVSQLVRGGLGVPFPGLEDGLDGARAGDTFLLTVPAELGLGGAGLSLGIPENAPTVVYVEVLDVDALPSIEVPEEVPTELTVTTLEEGAGDPAEVGDTVLVRYIGVLTETNRRVDSNWDGSPEPLVLGDDTYVTGFEDGLVGARAGDQLQIDIPADQAYGDDSVPSASIPSEAALSFLVDVVAVVPATSAADRPTDLDLPLSSTPMTAPPVTVDEATLESDPDATAPEAPPEVVITDIVEGDGETVSFGQTAIVNVLALCASNGAVLQDTWDDDVRQFIPVSSSSIIDGFADGLSGAAGLGGMKVGGLRMIQVPAALAYGDRGSEALGIGPDRDLIFVVELYGIA